MAMASTVNMAKRIPLIKFPVRRGLPAPAAGAAPASSTLGAEVKASAPVAAEGGSASSQPPRTKVSSQEMDALLMGGVV